MNHPELITKLTSLQGGLWPAVANQIGEATGLLVALNSPLVLETQVDEMLQEFAAPAVIAQFAFAGQREATQFVILPMDTASALLENISEEPTAVDEDSLALLRAPIDALIQGICIGLGNARNDVVVATDLAVRLGSFARPSNLQASDTMVRVQIAFGVGTSVGSLTWLLDSTSAHFIAGLSPAAAATTAAFPPLPPFGSSAPEESHGLDILMDVPLDISVELGRTNLVVKEVVDLGVGSIVEIDKAAGEPVDILVNGRLVARGEVVVIEDNFGVRITEILNPRERLARLGEAA